jgi:APA family basic amino acid/polyamine antiporter
VGSGDRGPGAWGEDGSSAGGTLGILGVLEAAGLLFFAFAGYARIATLAEEVRDPSVLGRAILWSLGVAIAVYAVVGLTLLLVLGTDLRDDPAPVAAAVRAAGAGWAEPVVRVGAAAACLGALLALLAGVGRTTMAMAREHDLPRTLARVDPVHQVPHHAQLCIGTAIAVLVCLADLRGAIGFSSFGVLVYYAVTNLAALNQPVEQRRWPRTIHRVGLAGCVLLAVTLPVASVLTGAAVLAVGLAGRLVLRDGSADEHRP